MSAHGRLAGKVALVTGSGSGIGRGIARLFAKEGARVIVVDLNEAGAKETAETIRGEGGESLPVRTNVLAAAEVRSLVDLVVGRYGRIDVLHNNVGGWQREAHDTVLDDSEEEWDRLVDLNLKSTFLVSREVVPHMVKQGGGAIVNTITINAFLTQPGTAAYSAAKAGAFQFTRAMALDLARFNVRVNGIAPGEIETPLWLSTYDNLPNSAQVKASVLARIPLGRFGTPEDVAFAALWLASDEARYVTGQVITVDGGITAGVYP
ncbi:MAG: glucose 1-dehydrogenase [Nitrososphaerales archaeon]|jgi:NAD(P)-dependent dehydrogenase (short-subunit alcohol dehydrogenase family)